jgi:hypothetical protein
MAYADFCPITTAGCPAGRCVKPYGLLSFSFVFLLRAHIQPIATEYARALVARFAQVRDFTQKILTPQVKQISPDKNMNFRDTTAPFTVPAGSPGFVILC